MSNNYFRFKRFTIEQEKCAMKVGTDGCLLGGWFDCSQSRRILDVGTGSGLIAIMAAQRSNAHVTGIEIDSDAVLQAKVNVKNSSWNDRIEIIEENLLAYMPDELFDTIVSNPPYFVNSLKCDDVSRTLARHSDSLGSDGFFSSAARLLTPDGKVSVIIPCDILEEWQSSAAEFGFYPSRTTFVKTTPRKNPKRVMVEFCREKVAEAENGTLVLEDSPGVYSEEAQDILRDFYLKIM